MSAPLNEERLAILCDAIDGARMELTMPDGAPAVIVTQITAHVPPSHPSLVAALAAWRDAYVAAEREACARALEVLAGSVARKEASASDSGDVIVLAQYDGAEGALREGAAAIRARGSK